MSDARPTVLVAELTHRCPLGCPYCSNPLALDRFEDELDTATWARIFAQSAAFGVRQVRLCGGEPGARRDLVEIAASAREAGLHTHLITSGVGITTRTMRDLWEAGLDHVHISFQDADAVSADHIAGRKGAFQLKHAVATEAVRLGLMLTVNVVVHRANIERVGAMIELALALKAHRIEIVHVQFSGWALKNRAALVLTSEQVDRAAATIEALQHRNQGRIDVDIVAFGRHVCSGHTITITPSGHVLPCQAAQSIPHLEFWNIRDRSIEDVWTASPVFDAFRSATARCVCRHLAVPDSMAQVDEIHVDAPYHYRR